MLGYDPDEIRETDDKWSRINKGLELWTGLVHPDDLESAQLLMRRHLEGVTDEAVTNLSGGEPITFRDIAIDLQPIDTDIPFVYPDRSEITSVH